MKLLKVLSYITVLASVHSEVDAYPGRGKLIVPPAPLQDTGLKHIPDRRHPYRPPGKHDLRGPCPGLNTLANHGYLPRNGIASFEEIVDAVQEGFNMEYHLGSAIVAFGMLARGNAYTNQVSIGGPSRLIPPLPDNIDGNFTRGLAGHGRFEGDVSMTRYDAEIGDHINFSQDLFNVLLDEIAEYGDDSDVTGPKSIVTYRALAEFKFDRFVQSQAANPILQYHTGRLTLSYGEVGFTMSFFANGTEETLNVPTLTSFFRDQRFPRNWSRRHNPGNGTLIGQGINTALNMRPVSPGENVDGKYVVDNEQPDGCSLYRNLAVDNLPRTLVNTTGLLKQNVDTLLNAIHDLFPDCPFLLPEGEPGV